MRGQKGITLVAWIITIVVLLILATVAITAMQEYDIIGNANQAADKYSDSQKNETNQLTEYNNFLNDYLTKYNGTN